jgi:hypothetical protein
VSTKFYIDGQNSSVTQNTEKSTHAPTLKKGANVPLRAGSSIQSLKADQNEGNCCWNGLSAILGCFKRCICGLFKVLCSCCFSKKEEIPPPTAIVVNPVHELLSQLLAVQEVLRRKAENGAIERTIGALPRAVQTALTGEMGTLPTAVQEILKKDTDKQGDTLKVRISCLYQFTWDVVQLRAYLKLEAEKKLDADVAKVMIGSIGPNTMDLLKEYINGFGTGLGSDLQNFVPNNPKHRYVFDACTQTLARRYEPIIEGFFT